MCFVALDDMNMFLKRRVEGYSKILKSYRLTTKYILSNTHQRNAHNGYFLC